MLPPRFGGRASRKTLLQEKRWSASRLTDGCRRTTRAFHPQRPAAGLISIAREPVTGNRPETEPVNSCGPVQLLKAVRSAGGSTLTLRPQSVSLNVNGRHVSVQVDEPANAYDSGYVVISNCTGPRFGWSRFSMSGFATCVAAGPAPVHRRPLAVGALSATTRRIRGRLSMPDPTCGGVQDEGHVV